MTPSPEERAALRRSASDPSVTQIHLSPDKVRGILDALEAAEQQVADLTKDYADFRRGVRSALWSSWPNNLGVGDTEIIDAVARCVAALREETHG